MAPENSTLNATDNKSALSVRNLSVYFGKNHAVKSVSLEIAARAVTAIIGPSGCGKSTFLRALNRMHELTPDARMDGEIRLFGEAISRLSPEAISRKGVGFVPQGRRVFASLTVRENLLVAEQSQGATRTWTLDRVLELFPSLRERQLQHAGSLSGGEQQMLAIGRALMGNPRVLLMDEPSEGLAPLIVAEVGRTIARLKQAGQSILLVEQNVRLAFDLADDVVLLNTGRVVFAGTVDQVRDDQALITQHLGVF